MGGISARARLCGREGRRWGPCNRRRVQSSCSAGLITIEKGYAGKRPRTWITLTKAGSAVLAEEITQLKLLISQIDRSGGSRG